MAPRVVRKLRLFSAHGFINPSDDNLVLLNYEEFFSELSAEGFKKFRLQTGGETVAISEVHKVGDNVAFLFVKGSESSITIFNERTGVTQEAELPENHIAVSATWLFWKRNSRFVFVESNRPGVGTGVIEKFFTSYGKNYLGHKNFTFDLNAVPGPSFEREIDRFTRIREVSVVLKRPNHAWSTAVELIGDAAESNAGTVELSVRAGRKQSLAKDRGIVQSLKDYAREKISGLKNVRVFGQVPGVEGEHSVSLENSQMTASTKLESGLDPSQNLQPLAAAVENFEEENSLESDRTRD